MTTMWFNIICCVLTYVVTIIVNKKQQSLTYLIQILRFGSDKMDKYLDKLICRRTSSFQHVTYPADKW